MPRWTESREVGTEELIKCFEGELVDVNSCEKETSIAYTAENGGENGSLSTELVSYWSPYVN